jgi:hypothetical protein
LKIRNEILNIIDKCTVEGNVVMLTCGQLDRKTYEEVNKCLESIGGKWNRKAKGHVFDSDPAELIDNLIITGETVDLKKEFQYFPTPKDIVLHMIEMAEIKPTDVLLEPEAGQGAIADLFPKENVKILIELNEKNSQILRDKGYEVMTKDFLETDYLGADKVIMNPPFSKQQDIDHICHAFDVLKSGGILVSIVSESPFFRENKKSVNFRKFLSDNNADIFELPEGAFKESGTMVKTRIIKIQKMN